MSSSFSLRINATKENEKKKYFHSLCRYYLLVIRFFLNSPTSWAIDHSKQQYSHTHNYHYLHGQFCYVEILHERYRPV